MKKLLYGIILFISIMIVCLLIGVLVLACNGYNFKFMENFNLDKTKIVKEETYDISEINEFNVRTISADVKVIKTDEPNIKVVQYSSDDEEELFTDDKSDKVLEINEQRHNCIFCFNRRSYFKVYIPESYYEEFNVKTTSGEIEIENDIDYSNISLRTTSGDIETKNINTSELYVSSTSGSIDIYDIEADQVTFKTTSGDITSGNITAEIVKIKSVSGEISIADSSATIELKTTSGDIECGNLSDSINAESTSGTIKIHRIIGIADIKTTSGDIKVASFAPTGDANFKSTSGSVIIEMREEADCSFSLDSSSGDIKYPGKMNNAQYEVNVKTSSGDIKIDD